MSEGQTHTRKKKNPVGRPTKYRGSATCDVVATTPLPATVTQIADHLGIDWSTVYDWMNEHPEFSQAVTRRRAQADDEIEGSLYGRAKGYDKTLVEEKLDKDGGTHALTKEVHIAADPNAAMNWLKNRRPDDWSDKKKIELTGDFVDRVKRAGVDAGVIEDDG